MPLPTNTEVDAAVPVAGTPSRSLVNALLKKLTAAFATVATSGAYADLSGKPALGTVAALTGPGGTALFLRSDDTYAAPAAAGGALGPYATVVALQSANPAASSYGKHASVGSAIPYVDYLSDGTAWSPSSTPVTAAIKAAIAEPGSRRHRDQAWNPPDAYAASTPYINGQSVVSSGNIYICINDGTSGAASPPTGTGNALIVDNTATWQYVGPTFAALAGAPTVSISASPPALPRCYRNALGTFASGASTVISNDGWFKSINCNPVLDSFGIGYFGLSAAGGIAFMTDGASVVIARNGVLNYGIRIIVDGRYVKPSLFRDIVTNVVYLTVNFGSRARRQVQAVWNMNSFCSLLGVYVDASSSLWKPKTVGHAIPVAAEGDSFLTNSGGYNSGDQDIGMGRQAFSLLGFDNVYIEAVGGTGFVATGPGTNYGSTSRLASLVAFKPKVILVQGSVNDGGTSQAAMTAAVAAYVAAVRATVGTDAYIVVTGIMGRGNTTGVELPDEAILRIAVAASAASDSRIFFIPCSGDPGGPWIAGTGTTAAPNGTGNTDGFMESAGTHPIQRGQEYLGQRLASALEPILRAL